MAAIENPTDMTVDDPLMAGRMHILGRIGMQMMLAMLGRPPQDALLGARLGKEGEDELEHPRGRIGAMGEIAVVSSTDRKDTQPIERGA